jgi:serine/threonine protein kinase/Tol biopolymer transport system component
MALTTGTKLGPYEILSLLGAGGMGKVYRARDTRLERTVAIKVLPEEFWNDSEFKQRFEREARTISSLNHPHICTLYDVGHQDGADYLVMEFIDGESLSQRLSKGPLPTEQLLKAGVQISEALDAAHRHGIIHRDLKPGNIMLTKSGAKLLDFGLAKPIAPLKVTAATSTPTFSGALTPITRKGYITGTLEYMSPEQIEGKEADARSDIFALGAVLYEMATGKRAFQGKSSISVASAILEKDPEPISKSQPMSPPGLEHVVKTCLAKEAEERWQSAADVGRELRWVAETGSQSTHKPVLRSRKNRERAWILAVAVLLLLAAYLWWRGGLPSRSETSLHVTVALPPGQALLNNSTQPVAISPDGRTIVYAAVNEQHKTQLYARKLDGFESTPIGGTEGGMEPFFSPDGDWLGFGTEDNKLKKVALRGGSSVLADTALPTGGSWSEDGTIYFVKSFTSGIYAVPANGGPERQVTHTGSSAGDRVHFWPVALPHNSGLIFTVWTGKSFNEGRIEVLSFKTGKRKVLIDGGTDAHYLSGGFLAYGRAGTVLVAGFDPERLELTSSPVPAIEGVMMGASNGDAAFGFSRNGTLIFEPGTFTSFQRNLVWMDRKGNASNIAAEVKPYAFPALSPDGKRIALTLQSSTFDVWVYDLERETFTKVSFGGDDYRPRWSLDGKMLAYDSSKTGQQQVFVKHASGQGPERVVTDGPENKELYDWTANNREVIFGRENKESGWDLYAAAVEGNHQPRPLVVGPFNQTQARASLDGKWLAYVSDESGQQEVFVQAIDDPSVRVQISREGGSGPRWARSGKELFYRTETEIFSVTFAALKNFRPSKPTLLFQDKREWAGYDVGGNDRFVVARDAEVRGSGTQINVVLNWFEELKTKARK